MEASRLDVLLTLAGQNYRVKLGACRSVATPLTIPSEAEKMTAHDVLDIPLSYTLFDGIINESAEGLVHRLVGVAADKDIDPLEAIHSTVVDIILGLVLHPEDIANLSPGGAYVTHTDVHEGTLAPVPILNTKCQSDVVQRKIIGILAGTIKLMISIHDAEDLVLVLFQVLDPPPLLL
jgi:hypothetical protein